MRKKLLSLTLALVMCLGLAVPASAHDMGKVGESNAICVGGSYTGLLDKSGALWMWGGNSGGELGNGTLRNPDTFVKVMDSVATDSGGSYHVAAIKTDGSLWTWGINDNGQLGNGGGSNTTTVMGHPSQTVPVKVMDSVTAVSCGGDCTAAIKTDGSLWMWGSNEYGQLGNDGGNAVHKYDGPYQTVPVKVLDNAAAVSCGGDCTAAIKTDGTLWMWGRNDYGQLGNGTETDSSTPVKVLDNVAAVSCGSSTNAAIKTDGSLWMWGSNSCGQLGLGYTDRWAGQPVPVKVLDNVAAVSCGNATTAAIKTDGSLWMWGDNTYGELGNSGSGNDTGNTGDPCQTVPVKVLDSVAAVSCGMQHTAAIKTDGTLWTWGRGDSGQLGYQDVNATGEYSTRIQTVPKQVEGLTASVPTTGTTTPDTTGPQVSEWAKEQVSRAAENGLVPDSLGNNYRATITRVQFAATVVKLYEAMSSQKAPTAGNSPFTDTSDTAVIQAEALGIVSGVGGGKFAPDALVTRQEAAAMLSRVYTKLGGNIPEVAATTFADNDKVSGWARNAVAFMADKGIVKGVGNNSFDPLGNASIEEALVIA